MLAYIIRLELNVNSANCGTIICLENFSKKLDSNVKHTLWAYNVGIYKPEM